MHRIPIALLTVAVLAMTGCEDDPGTDIDLDGDEPVEHTFVYIPSDDTPDITSINVAGSFAEEGETLFWNPGEQPMTEQSDGTWEFTTELDPGVYEYKYVFNGDQWPSNMCDDQTWGHPDHDNDIDPNLQECIDDTVGGMNAQLTID